MMATLWKTPSTLILVIVAILLPLVLSQPDRGKVLTETEGRRWAARLQSATNDSFFDETLSLFLNSFSKLNSPKIFTSDFIKHYRETIEVRGRTNSSSTCDQDVLRFFLDVVSGEKYTMQVLDAAGKIPSGLSKGDFTWLGSFDLCQSIIDYENASDIVNFQGKYCIASMPAFFLPPQLQMLGLKVGICVPDTCGNEELTPLIQMGVMELLKVLKVSEAVMNATVAQSGAFCAEPAEWTTGDVAAITLTSLLVFLALLGTSYDIIKRIMTEYGNTPKAVYVTENNVQEHTEDTIADLIGNEVLAGGIIETASGGGKSPNRFEGVKGFFHNFLLGFSVITNGEKLLSGKVREGTLGAVHGIRVLSMWWVILGHTYAFIITFLKNPLDMLSVLKRFSFQAIANATFSVDTFFFLSGLLMAYLLLRELARNSGKTNWVLLYVHRYWRLTPTYMFILMIFTTLSLHIPEGPYMRSMDSGATTCSKYWWTNLLYINNIYPSSLNDECMGWSWYLANDMQFFILSPLLIFLLYRFTRAGYAVIMCLLVGSLIATGVTAKMDKISTYILDGGYGKGFNDIYVRPWFRISAYLVGIICGHCIHVWNAKGQPKLYKAVVVVGWSLAIAINMSVLYGEYGQLHTGIEWNEDVNALYIATSRMAWSVGLGWLTFACITGYGGPINTFLSWSVWAPLGRLTYCAYLIHPIVIFNYYLSTREQMLYTDYNTIYIYIGHIVISYLAAFVVSLLVEAPTLALEKIIFKRKQA